MLLRRTRVWLASAIAALAFVLALVPVLAWRHERAGEIRASFDSSLTWMMEQVLRGVLADERPTEFDAWAVNSNEGWIDPLHGGIELEPPLLTWMRDAGEYAGFRDYSVDGTAFRAYVLPVRPGNGFVTLMWTGDRDDDLGALDLWTAAWVMAAALLAAGVGWWLAGVALRPTRQALADQQGFLADAAHEMRTPLAVILASSSQALARPRPPEEYVRSLAEIRSAAERASSGVNELLELARFDSGQALPRVAPVRLDLLAEEVAASVRADGCEVVAEPTDPVVVHADMPLLRQALDNVVRNAVRRSTRVEVLTARSGRDGVVTVIDDGPGFDASSIEHVFDRYRRGDRKGEVGIGLSIVKAIVTAHGGEVAARNADGAAPGACSGAVVELRIPLAPSA
jgi:signal transduction histidine kinase